MELRNIMYTAQLDLDHPIAIRYPRGRGITIDWKQPFTKIEISKGIQLKIGKKLAVLSIGAIAQNVTEAIKDIEVSHYDMRFAKPLDEKLLHTIFKKYDTIVTVEDGTKIGGFGSSVFEFASIHHYKNIIKVIGIPDTFIEHGSVNELQKTIGLDVESLTNYFNLL